MDIHTKDPGRPVDVPVSVPVAAVRALVARARLAPSTHNTQPW